MDHGEPDGDLRARGALETMVDLMLQQLGCLIEEIDRHESIRKPADHFVTAPADWRQFAKVIKQAERLDRREGVALASQKEIIERRRGIVLDAPGQIGI